MVLYLGLVTPHCNDRVDPLPLGMYMNEIDPNES